MMPVRFASDTPALPSIAEELTDHPSPPISANRRRLWGSGLGDPVTDNWPDFGTRVTIDGTVRASCVRLTDIPEYIGASTQTVKFVWYWTVSSKRLED